jgi:tetratricopeptide (TPR) repeat protein
MSEIQSGANSVFQRARKLQREGRLEEAIALYRKAIELNKMLEIRTSFYFYKTARYLKRKNLLEDAAQMYECAIKHNYNFAWYYYELAETLTKLGRIEKAIEAYKQGINIRPNSPFLHDSSELYVAPLYNNMIKEGGIVKYHLINRNDVVFCGTPSEYESLKLAE